MANDKIIPQQLKEILDRGYVSEDSHFVESGSYVSKNVAKIEQATASKISEKSNAITVGFCFDGSFLPIRNGACYNVYNLMRALSDTNKIDCNLMLCYRGWDNPSKYYNQKFNTIFIAPADYYEHNENVEKFFKSQRIQFVHFYSSEGVLNLAQRLRNIGIKSIFEIQNIDYVLYERLGSDAEQINKAKELQKQALKICDYALCRSDIDKELAIQLGADPTKLAVYKGGIYAKDFQYVPRKNPRHKLVFLGHLFYPPNENAVKLMVEQILPKLSSDYTLTIIGIGPEELVKKYQNQQVIFKKGIDDLSEELKNYDVALAPLFEGSGTRLKILDYLASGIPTISTSIGIEGLDLDIKKHLYIEDQIENYPEIIENIMKNLPNLEGMTYQARKFVEENYDWSTCLEPFLQAYDKLVS